MKILKIKNVKIASVGIIVVLILSVLIGIAFGQSQNLAESSEKFIQENVDSFNNSEDFQEKLKFYVNVEEEAILFAESDSFFKKFGQYSKLGNLYEETLNELDTELNKIIRDEYQNNKYVEGLEKSLIVEGLEVLNSLKDKVMSVVEFEIIEKESLISNIGEDISKYENDLSEIELEEERIKKEEEERLKKEQEVNDQASQSVSNNSTSGSSGFAREIEPDIGVISPNGYAIVWCDVFNNGRLECRDTADDVWDNNWNLVYNLLDFFEKIPN